MLVRRLKQSLAVVSLIIGLALSGHAQGVSVSGQAVVNTATSVSGIPGNRVLQAVPNAQITVCASTGGGIPCSPLVTIYSNPALTVTTANPLTADANGNFVFFVAPNTAGYLYSQTGSGITGQLFTIVPQSLFASGPVSNANLPNPMNLTDTLSVSSGTHVAQNLTVSGGTHLFTWGSTTFPSSSFSGFFQGAGVSGFVFLPTDSLGTGQLGFSSRDMGFIPSSAGGLFSLGTSGGQYQITTDTGLLKTYNSVGTSGNGQAVLRSFINQTVEITGNSGTLTLVTPTNNNSVYRLTIYTTISTGVATSTIQWTASFTDVTGARTTVGTSIAGDTLGTHLGEEFRIEAQSGVAITLATATVNSPKYKYFVRLEEL